MPEIVIEVLQRGLLWQLPQTIFFVQALMPKCSIFSNIPDFWPQFIFFNGKMYFAVSELIFFVRVKNSDSVCNGKTSDSVVSGNLISHDLQ